MSEEATSSDSATQITFNIKASTDSRYTVTVPENSTVADLKQKLSSAEYADIPPERQRLIYSGRVMKDPDALATYKIKDGNTVHMVKGAASNQQRNPENAGQSGSQSQVPPNAGVPQNLATGTGTDPLAGLTGARYAGFAQMPGAGMFGPDGGMGAPQSSEEMLNMLDNPMVQAQFNEAMNNPHVIQMLQNNPMIRDQPMMREMLNNPEFRRMLFDPQFLRTSMQMSRMMGGGGRGGGGNGGMPAPGVTDMTPQSPGQQRQQNQQNPTSPTGAGQQQQTPDPFSMFGTPVGGQQQNPFAMLNAMGGGMRPPQQQQQQQQQTSSQPFTTNSENQPSSDSTNNTSQRQQQQQPPPNPFAAMFNQQPPGQTPGQDQGQSPNNPNPIMDMANQMMQNPEMMRMAMNSLGGMGGMPSQTGQQPGQPGQGGQQQHPFNPFAMLGGMPGAGAVGTDAPQPQQDTRPPEEQYATQLQQLNEMGLHDFERNVRALRMTGGHVEAAVEMLFSGSL